MKKSSFRLLFDKLGIRVRYNNGVFSGTCPIHNGDNPSAFSLYENSGIWTCWTHNCQEKWGNTPKGLVSAILHKADKDISPDDFLKDKNIFLNDIIQPTQLEIPKNPKIILDRSSYLDKVSVPSEYYLNRGFSKKILKKYDVGVSLDKSKYFYNGSIIPVYNPSYTGIIAYSIRRNTTKKEDRWRHMSGQWRGSSLYNIWFAKSYIKNSKSVILCESPAKVWRLVESGFYNCLGLFGTKLSYGQEFLLKSCSAETVIILMDNDIPGQIATKNIAKKLQRHYNIIIPKISFVDLDETEISIVKKELKGQF